LSTRYTLHGTQVRYLGSELLSLENIETVIRYTLRRKEKRAGAGRRFAATLIKYGEAVYSWNFTRQTDGLSDRYWASLEARREASGFYRLYCAGPMAEYAIGRVQAALARRAERFASAASFENWRLEQRESWRAKQKRLKLERSQQNRLEAPKQERKPRRPAAPAKPSFLRHEKVVPQFKGHYVSWQDAVKATVAIFQVAGDYLHSATEIVERRLKYTLQRSSLDPSCRAHGIRYAKYEQGGFTLRFDVVFGLVDGESTHAVRLTITATKDNQNPLYRRMRRYFQGRMVPFSRAERTECAARTCAFEVMQQDLEYKSAA
jgi:hypothetical protein